MASIIREYGVGLVLANQFLDQLSEELQKAIFGNFGQYPGLRCRRL